MLTERKRHRHTTQCDSAESITVTKDGIFRKKFIIKWVRLSLMCGDFDCSSVQ